MTKRNKLDVISRNILHVLSLFEHLTLLQLWYELGEDGASKERMTKKEILSRLESLMEHGLVEQLTEAGGDIRWALKTGEVGDDLMDLQAG
jgi:hypothetical protein